MMLLLQLLQQLMLHLLFCGFCGIVERLCATSVRRLTARVMSCRHSDIVYDFLSEIYMEFIMHRTF